AAMPVLPGGATIDAPRRFHGIAPARSDLPEVRAVSLVEAQRRLRQARWRAIHAREVTPPRVRHAVDGLSIDRGENPFASTHLLHARSTPSVRTDSPRSSTASNASRSRTRPRPRTVKVDGMNTNPVKRTRSEEHTSE